MFSAILSDVRSCRDTSGFLLSLFKTDIWCMLCYKVLCYEVNPKFIDPSMIEPIREFTSVGGKVSVLAGSNSCLFLAAYSSTAFPAAILSLNAFARKFIIFNFFSDDPLD